MENKKKQKSYEINKKYYKDIIALMPGHVYWKDKNGIYLGCNLLQAKDAGFDSPEEMVGKTDYDMPWNIQADYLRNIDCKVMELGESLTLEELSELPDGTKQIYLTNKLPLYDEENEVLGVLGISFDITEKKQMERELWKTNKMLENVINTIPGHVYWKDKSSVYLGSNDEQARDVGLKSRQDIVGLSQYDITYKKDADAVVRADAEVMNSGKPITIEEIELLPNNQERIWLSNKVPLRDEENEIIGVLGVSIDITEKRNTEKKLQDTEDRLSGMTVVSASVAHELRTPLASVSLNASFLEDYMPALIKAYHQAKEAGLEVDPISDDRLEGLSKVPDTIEKVTRSGFKFIDILLMNVDPKLDAKIEPFPISHCINQALSTYPFQSDQCHLMNWEAGLDFIVEGNELLVTHILYNLIRNALYYIAKAGKGEIKIWLDVQSKENLLFFEDTGEGIDAEALPHVFERFFTNTPHGAGVGLTFCKMVMEKVGGNISCESQKNKYTRFILTFPKFEKP